MSGRHMTISADEVSARNYRYYVEYAFGRVKPECYDCEKFTYYGKTCKGKCDKVPSSWNQKMFSELDKEAERA